MSSLKGLTTGILSFLLFVCLSIFGVSFLLHSTLLNPDFVSSEVNKLDITAVIREFVDEEFEDEIPREAYFIKEAVYDIIAQEEPWIKEQADYIIYTGYDYFLGKENVLTITIPIQAETAALKERLWDALKKELPTWLPNIVGQEIGPYVDQHIQEYRKSLPRELLPFGDDISNEQLSDYLHQYLQDTNTQINTGSLPPLDGLLEALVRPFYDQYYDDVAAEIPEDEIIYDQNLSAETRDALLTVRHYIGVFNTWYYILIFVMLLLIAGIILINRNVRIITRSLGIDFTIYGLIEFVGVLFARTIDFTGMISDLPASLETWITGFFRDLLLPLQWFSLGILIAGIILLVVSFVYKPRTIEVTEGS